MLVDIVSRNGNLLLNFPLPNSGMPDDKEMAILESSTSWMGVNSEGIYATRPWKVFGAGPGAEIKAGNAQFNEANRQDLTADDVRYTRKGVGRIQNVELLGAGKMKFTQDETALKILIHRDTKCKEHGSSLVCCSL